MKITYYGYTIHRQSDNCHFLFDLRSFIKCFVGLDNIDFKNQFMHNEEHVYLLEVKKNRYIFLSTRSSDIIKKIRSTDHSVSEISELLNTDEFIGFASFVFMRKSSFAFASTVLAPKIQSFVSFINDVISAIDLDDYTFVAHPLLQESSFADALKEPFLGRSAIQVSKDNTFFEDIANFFDGTTEEFADVDSFEVIIKPRKRKNIENAVKKVIQKIQNEEEGLTKFTCKAKQEISGNLIDLYLVGQGAISDIIKKGSDLDIVEAMMTKVKDNSRLRDKVKEHEANETFEEDQPKDFLPYNDSGAWTDILCDL